MQTVQFQCGHCGSTMGVNIEFLGQEVRCPTCQQVVVAPAAADQFPPEPSPTSDSTEKLFLANLQSAPIGDPPMEPQLAAPSGPAEPAPAPEPVAKTHEEAPTPHASSLPWHDSATSAADASSLVARAQRQAGGGISWLWLLPLLSYSILATAAAVYIYFSLQTANETIREQNKRLKDLEEKAKMHDKAPDPKPD
jgi:hypothetical protein